jgi:hypothetical protein
MSGHRRYRARTYIHAEQPAITMLVADYGILQTRKYPPSGAAWRVARSTPAGQAYLVHLRACDLAPPIEPWVEGIPKRTAGRQLSAS